MCGTSLDGIDAALVAIDDDARRRYTVERFATYALADELRRRLLRVQSGSGVAALDFSRLHCDVGTAFGEAASAIARDAEIAFVASHGITVAHDGGAPHTLQVGDAFRIRERMGGVPVAYDFRAADCAAGGTGAPLVPFVDALLFGDAAEDRVALNLGGIANLTVLRRGADADDAIAFDSGPANMTIDGYLVRRTADTERFDRDGARAARGRIDDALLASLADDPYYRQAPPKATGRERFGDAFFLRFGDALDRLALDDAVATLTALTARTVAAAIGAYAPPGARVIASGGGRRNPTLMRALASALPDSAIDGSEAYGVDPDAKEALAFAVLGDTLLAGRRAGLPRVTGARSSALLGAIAPDARF
jgi:anhydro-N-acetylmuramic acid kinase